MIDIWTFDNDELFDLVACGKKIALSCSHMCPKHTKERVHRTTFTEYFINA